MSAASDVLPPLDNLPLDGPVESVADLPAVAYEPFLADKKYHKTSPPEFLTLTEEQEAIYQEVFKHFTTDSDYVIPGLKDGEGNLAEEEKFYLVRSTFLTCD